MKKRCDLPRSRKVIHRGLLYHRFAARGMNPVPGTTTRSPASHRRDEPGRAASASQWRLLPENFPRPAIQRRFDRNFRSPVCCASAR
jgi:hypothetical protein